MTLLLLGCGGAGARAPGRGDRQAPPAPPSVPEAYAFESAEDYARHRDTVVACLRWLTATHPGDAPETREAATRYAMKWLSGNRDLTVLARAEIIGPVVEEVSFRYAEAMPLVYLASKALHILEHPDATEQDAEVAGVHGIIRMYEILVRRDPGVRSEVIEEYVRLRDQGDLARRIAELPPAGAAPDP